MAGTAVKRNKKRVVLIYLLSILPLRKSENYPFFAPSQGHLRWWWWWWFPLPPLSSLVFFLPLSPPIIRNQRQ